MFPDKLRNIPFEFQETEMKRLLPRQQSLYLRQIWRRRMFGLVVSRPIFQLLGNPFGERTRKETKQKESQQNQHSRQKGYLIFLVCHYRNLPLATGYGSTRRPTTFLVLLCCNRNRCLFLLQGLFSGMGGGTGRRRRDIRLRRLRFGAFRLCAGTGRTFGGV